MSGPKTILVVDDHDAPRKVLELVLGAHLLQMSGFDVARRARHIARLRHVPILIMTAAANERTRTEADAIGASRVLHKPTAGTDLRQVLQELLGQASGVSASPDALGA